MNLGCFSVSLSVKDLAASKAFYEKLGFTVYAGGMEEHFLIMKNGSANIGLFEGMFEGNILTFNPGWDQDAKPVEEYTDARELHAKLKDQGIVLTKEVDPLSESGPANFTLQDPDGNTILIDQHV